MYDIKELINKENKFKEECKQHFIEFFKKFKYEDLDGKNIDLINIESHKSINDIRYGSGFYLILTDYMADRNLCTFKIDQLKVIYRGHGVRMKKRIESHLFNIEYNQNKNGTNYTACMKLNNDNGINIDKKPYLNYSWKIIQHPMSKSSKTMREQAEQAFDEFFKRPIGSNA